MNAGDGRVADEVNMQISTSRIRIDWRLQVPVLLIAGALAPHI